MAKFILKITFILFLLISPLFSARNVSAIENPLASPNNPYGIHIHDETDLEDAARLVNSQGGDWGYVTLVIRKDERDSKRWQAAFDEMRRLHLIPIVRIATREQDGGWEKPSFDEIPGWVSFLDSLNWVVKNRYVVVGNEPNHAVEWGDEVNPQEYALYLKTLSEKLKEASGDFFILPAALDASAPNSRTNMSEITFLKRMLTAEPQIFDYIDGWASHSYPNPNFSGSEGASGQGTIRTFDWELSELRKLGVNKDLPVFITETGWAHKVDGEKDGYEDVATIADKLKSAFLGPWRNARVVAVTPFILNYQGKPFNIFSWKAGDNSFYPAYKVVKDMDKPAGKPIQIISGKILATVFPPILKINNKYLGVAYVENTGQTIWEMNQISKIEEKSGLIDVKPIFSKIEPLRSGFVFFAR